MADNTDHVSWEIEYAIDRKDEHQLRAILPRTSTCPEDAILWAMDGKVNLDKETLSLMIEKGANVNAVGVFDRTALMYACWQGFLECAQLLLDYGADVNARDDDRWTPLWFAIWSCSSELVQVLIDYGADVSAKDNSGRNALMNACDNDFIKGARLLIENGADVNDRDNDGETALMVACKLRFVKCLKLLIDHGADVNVRSYKDRTPLEHACSSGYLDCVKCLTDHGADIHATNASGNKVLSQIDEFTPSHRGIYNLLTRLGAKDDDYKHLMSLNSEATDDRKHEAKVKLDEIKTKWQLSLKCQAQWAVYQTNLSIKGSFRNIIETLINDGLIPQRLKTFMLFEDSAEKQEMAIVLQKLYASHEVRRKLSEYREMRQERPYLKETFELLKLKHRKLLQWIPVVKFYGMGEDGLYSIHIVDGCVNKTSAFIESMIPGYKFHSVPWRKDESIQLLGYPGGPLHNRQRSNADEGMLENLVTHPDGTIGGLAALVGDKSEDDIYILTANHVVKPDVPDVEYISWSKDDQSDKHVIGREVPYRIPLRMDNGDNNDDNEDDSANEEAYEDSNYTDWDDDNTNDSQETFNERMYGKCVSDLIMEDKDMDEKEEQQYDIACIKMVDQDKDVTVDINADVKDQIKYSPDEMDKQHKTTKHQYNACSKCCNYSFIPIIRSDLNTMFGSKVVKLGSSLEQVKGKIFKADAAGEIKVGKDTAWVENMIAIGAKTSDSDIPYTQPGDSGTIVCNTDTDEKGHYPYSWMIFAGWNKINDQNTSGRPVSLAFYLRDALNKLTKQVNMEDEPNKKFQLRCCKTVFQQTEEEE